MQLHTTPKFSYEVAMSAPTSHYFEVTLSIENWQEDQLDLKMPAWTPGSYLIREYVRHLQDFVAVQTGSNQYLNYQKISKHHWQIETAGIDQITVQYRVYAYDLSVRTNHLDDTHGYFNGAALFFFVGNWENIPIALSIIAPDSWKVTTALPPLETQKNTFIAANFDTLVDCPVEIGSHELYPFSVLGKPHYFAVWGTGNFNRDRVIKDTIKIIETEAEIFEGLPYEHYYFILHLSSQNFGGLEHKDSCSLIYNRFGFKDPEKYYRFIQLVAHEFFHLWNVKRIRPKALEKFDYEQENYTPSLWFSEGSTSYYDLLIPLRAKIYDSKTFLQNLSKEITRYLLTPGHQVQPLAESSFDAWIKLYRRDAHSDNCQISYYLKGELVTLLLDLFIRDRFDNQKSFDDVLRRMWDKFGKTEQGFTPEQLEAVISGVAEADLSDFFQRYLYSTENLPFEHYFEQFGLQLQPIFDEPPSPYLGLKVQTEQGKEIIKFVAHQSPAEVAGISPNDELLAMEGIRVTADQLSNRLRDYQTGDMIEITVFHQDLLKTVTAQLAEPKPSRYEIVRRPNQSEKQIQNFVGWLEAL